MQGFRSRVDTNICSDLPLLEMLREHSVTKNQYPKPERLYFVVELTSPRARNSSRRLPFEFPFTLFVSSEAY